MYLLHISKISFCVTFKGYEEKQERLRRERKKEGELDDGAVKEEVKKSATKSARKKKYGNAYSELVEEAFNKAYMYTDLLLSWGKEEHSRVKSHSLTYKNK